MPIAALKEKTKTNKPTGGALSGASALLFAGGLIALAASGAADGASVLITASLCAALYALASLSRGTVFAFLPVLALCAAGSYVCIQLFSLGAFSWFTESGTPLHLFGALWVLTLYLALYALTGSIRAGALAGGAVCAAFGVANYALTLFRGRPFLAIDITSIRTALNVSDSYQLTITPVFALALLMAVSLAALGFALGDPPPQRPRWPKWTARGASALMAGTYVYLVLCTYMITNTGIFVLWDENQYAESAVMYFAITTEKLSVSEPEGYGDGALSAIADEIESEKSPAGAVTEEKPNIIVVMNESFSDLSTLGEFETSEPIAPFISSLTENTVKGHAYSSVIGGNTANSEYEFLTGDTMAFVPTGTVPYQLYVNNETDTVVSALEAQGYTTTAMHPYLSSGWNRVRVYDLFGFDKVLFKDDFTDKHYLRNYVTDASNYANVIAQYEENRDGDAQFIFNITMQNHGGYTFEGFEPTVSITGHEGEFPMAEQYLSLVNISDDATRELVEYFASEDEPTVILFFGDHQPKLEEAFYEMADTDAGEDTVAETEKRYSTPFFIWANYDIPEAEGLNVSINYLSALLMDAAGLRKTGYQTFLGDLSESWPVINALGAMDAEGNWYSLYDPAFTESEAVQDYRILQYNHLFDPGGLRSDIFGLDPEG